MTRSELIKRLSVKLHLKPADVAVGVELILREIANAVSSGRRVELRGFGRFTLGYRRPRKGRNPKSGKVVEVPEKYVPRFKAGKEMRIRILDGKG